MFVIIFTTPLKILINNILFRSYETNLSHYFKYRYFIW